MITTEKRVGDTIITTRTTTVTATGSGIVATRVLAATEGRNVRVLLAVGTGCDGARTSVVADAARYPISLSRAVRGQDGSLESSERAVKVGGFEHSDTAWGIRSPGLTCTAIGCVAFCEMSATCDDGSTCNAFTPELAIDGRSFGYCLPPSCGPLRPTEPERGLASCASEQCRFVSDQQTACFPSTGRSPHVTGAPCEDDLDCSPSDSCFEQVCTRLCRIGRDDCGRRETCVAGASDVGTPVLGGETFGHCARVDE